MLTTNRSPRRFSAVLLIALGATVAVAGEPKFQPPADLAALDAQINWSHCKLIAVQDQGRYKTLDSFAREAMTAMCGKEQLPGLSPIGSALEWMFNARAYADAPVVYIKDRGLRIHFSTHMDQTTLERVRTTGYMTLRELADDRVQQRKNEMEPKTRLATAMNRLEGAMATAFSIDRLFRVVPRHTSKADDLWATPDEIIANLPAELRELAQRRMGSNRMSDQPVEGISSDQASSVLTAWALVRASWLDRDATGVQQALDRLTDVLQSTAKAGEYPSLAKRQAEALYYRMGKFTFGQIIYFFGVVIGVFALVTRWKTPWMIGLIVLIAALGLHAFSIGLRWSILGRIPVANMFEAVVGAAWAGACVAIILEFVFRTRIFLLAAHVTGFVGLAVAEMVSPGGGTLTSIRAILDDVMLRIHTTLIIWSYALIFLASVIGMCYLFGYYLVTNAYRSAESGLITMIAGGTMLLVAMTIFSAAPADAPTADGFIKSAAASWAFGITGIATALLLTALGTYRAPGNVLVATTMLLLSCGVLTFADRWFVIGTAWTMIISGLTWMLATMSGFWLRRQADPMPRTMLAGVGGAQIPVSAMHRPIMAGGAPGDEARSTKLPRWLYDFDWAHLIILNLVFVMLFVG
ncbi:MAG: hypothetical protein HZB38_01385, partial [Planctomycetes bacterium]|nr:hypothetical protein [Planctomycetota bacterium]